MGSARLARGLFQMGNSTDINPPFGHHALPPAREARRFSARRMGNTRLGRWTISLCRKQAIRGLPEPFDVTVAPGVRARLYPSTNRCEKRALCGVQIWDAAERHALRQAITAASDGGTFVFLDIGANVGLYALFAHSYARQANQPIRIIAVEPSAEMGARLAVNAQASDASIALIRTAIATRDSDVFLSDGGSNRGEGHIADSGEAVKALPLFQLCREQSVTRIDALKLDIEGVDLAVLTQFFAEAPASLHPRMMILELDTDSAAPLIELTQANDYLIITRTRMNVVVRKRDQT